MGDPIEKSGKKNKSEKTKENYSDKVITIINECSIVISNIINDWLSLFNKNIKFWLKYNSIQRVSKIAIRKLFPVPKSPYTIWEIDDISSVNLVPPEKLKVFFADCIKILQDLKWDEIWDYLEFGVFNGSSISSMYTTAKELELKSMNFFGFDAFQWLPESSKHEDDWVWEKWFYECSFDNMRQCLEKKGINPNDIKWVKWWYEDTLNEKTASENWIKNIWIAFIDCDTYSSSKTVLDFLKPLLNEPAILCFDDWKLNDLDVKWMWEYKAFNEFLEENKEFRIKEIKSYNRKSKSFLIYKV